MRTDSQRVGICSWSLSPAGAHDACDKAIRAGVRTVQLALDPIRRGEPGWSEIETRHALDLRGVTPVSGMMAMIGEDYSSLRTIRQTGGVRPDEHWLDNLAAARSNARLARRLGIGLVTFHAGFIPHGHGPERTTLHDRIRAIADAFDECGVLTALETGQERAETLMESLEELDRTGGAQVGVNFDPANMILYGMGDPNEAVRVLATRIAQVHIKDARPSPVAGEWGSEVRAGAGAVDWRAFFQSLRERGVCVPLVIERESRTGTESDLVVARRLIERLATKPASKRSPRRATAVRKSAAAAIPKRRRS